jgi:DtxR family Mn-dependent transcriptional regulator
MKKRDSAEWGKNPHRRDFSESVEEYLEAMCRLIEEGKSLTTKNISEKLGVSPASTSEMLKRLQQEGYVSHRPYRHISLTRRGRYLGGKILRRHRILERFLSHIGLRRHRIHGEACRLEHYISDELGGLMEKGMDTPDRSRGILSLTDMRRGDRGEVFCIEGGRMLARRLEDMGLTPGAKVKVLRLAPFAGPVEIQVRDSCLVLGRRMAARIFIKVVK